MPVQPAKGRILSKKLLLEDYDNWADEFIDYSNAVDHRDISNMGKFLIIMYDRNIIKN